ncbi:unnamed protein product [Rotaria magnacalcarata]|nr:unnamed protein product [Rotaria magnacalcarata]
MPKRQITALYGRKRLRSYQVVVMFDLGDLVKSVEMFEVTWSLEHKDKSDKNEPFIDVAVAHHHQQDGFYLFLRQCINMTDTANDENKTICCGYLSYKLNNINAQKEQALAGAEFYVPNNLAHSFRKAEKDFVIINNTIAKFIYNATRLGAVLVNAGNDVSMVSMAQQVFNRMNTATHNDVVVRLF